MHTCWNSIKRETRVSLDKILDPYGAQDTEDNSASESDLDFISSTPPFQNMSAVHISHSPYDVYIGRPSRGAPNAARLCIWGNPFPMHHEGERSRVILQYERWLLSPQQSVLVTKAKQELKGKILACWCAPRACHGDVLMRVAEESDQETDKRRRELRI